MRRGFSFNKAVGQKMILNKKGGIYNNIIYGIVAPDHRIYNNIFINGQEMSSAASYFYKVRNFSLTNILQPIGQNIILELMLSLQVLENNQPRKFIKNYRREFHWIVWESQKI